MKGGIEGGGHGDRHADLRFGWKAVDVKLPATDGQSYSILECAGPSGLLVAFICNPCPYVKAIIGRLVRDASRAARCGAQGEGGREAAARPGRGDEGGGADRAWSAGSDPLDGLLDQMEGRLTGIAVSWCPQQPPCFYEPDFHCQA